VKTSAVAKPKASDKKMLIEAEDISDALSFHDSERNAVCQRDCLIGILAYPF